jgi:hypothetical protein
MLKIAFIYYQFEKWNFPIWEILNFETFNSFTVVDAHGARVRGSLGAPKIFKKIIYYLKKQ